MYHEARPSEWQIIRDGNIKILSRVKGSIIWAEKFNVCHPEVFNLLKSTGHVMHHQFNIQQLYALPTLYLCVLYLSESKQRFVPLTA